MRDPSHPRRRFRLVAAAAVLPLALAAAASGGLPATGGMVAGEYEIKAAMLLNLAKFVEWPAWKMGEPRAAFVVGIWGPEGPAVEMEKVLRDKNVEGKPVAVRRLTSLARVEECHILFVAREQDRGFTAEEAAALARAAVLTAGETGRFTAEGGVIGLMVKDNRVQIEVNLRAAQNGNLVISSRVLRLAAIAQGGP